MSYSENVKKQLCNVEIKEKKSFAAEIAGILASGAVKPNGKIPSRNPEISDRFSFLQTKASLSQASSFLKEDIDKISSQSMSAFIRGAFLMRGTVTQPSSAKLHLECAFSTEEYRDKAILMLANLEIVAKSSNRAGRYTYYIKDFSQIADFLSIIGVSGIRFEYENEKLLREMNGQYTRTSNIDASNYDKMSVANSRHLSAIKALMENDVYDSLPVKLKEMATVRMKYPFETLEQLGRHLDPPVSKAGVNHRLSKIIEIASPFM